MSEHSGVRSLPGLLGWLASSDGWIFRPRRRCRWGWTQGSLHRTNGKLYFIIKIDGKACQIGRLILEAFVGPCPEGMECRHLDDNGLNNQLSNLAWGTKKENAADRKRNGHEVRLSGERNGWARFSCENILELRDLYWNHGVPVSILARGFHTAWSTVSDAVNLRTWRG